MVHITHDVVWLYCMFYLKTNSVGEFNTDHISVGNWPSKMHWVLQFIEVGEGISEGSDQEPQENNNLNDLENQPVGNDIEEEEHPMEEENPTTYTTAASGQVSKPQHALLKNLGKLH